MRYVLLLNDMRSSNIENLHAVRVGQRDELIAWHDSLLVEPYMDGVWRKSFRKDSELEWCNPGTFKKDEEFFGGVYRLTDDFDDEEAMRITLTK